MTDISQWLDGVEKKLRCSGARANISVYDVDLLIARLRAAVRAIDHLEKSDAALSMSDSEDEYESAMAAVAAFRAACQS